MGSAFWYIFHIVETRHVINIVKRIWESSHAIHDCGGSHECKLFDFNWPFEDHRALIWICDITLWGFLRLSCQKHVIGNLLFELKE